MRNPTILAYEILAIADGTKQSRKCVMTEQRASAIVITKRPRW